MELIYIYNQQKIVQFPGIDKFGNIPTPPNKGEVASFFMKEPVNNKDKSLTEIFKNYINYFFYQKPKNLQYLIEKVDFDYAKNSATIYLKNFS